MPSASDTFKVLAITLLDTIIWASTATDLLKFISALGTAIYIWIKLWQLWKTNKRI